MAIRILFRRDLASNWRDANPVLGDGEPGYEIDTGLLKIGDGSARWIDLNYFVPKSEEEFNVTVEMLNEHINSERPHPVYDDGPSLVLLYQNAKV